MRKVKSFECVAVEELEGMINSFVEENGVHIVEVQFQLQTMADRSIMTFGLLIYEEVTE